MLASILVAAAGHAEKAEPSKAAFYIVGGALVVWAVAVSVLGIKKDSFAASKATGRLVAAISIVLVAGTMAASVLTA